jgi:hypothetical protein
VPLPFPCAIGRESIERWTAPEVRFGRVHVLPRHLHCGMRLSLVSSFAPVLFAVALSSTAPARADTERGTPAGYHVESKPNLGLAITGLALHGVSYLTGAVIGPIVAADIPSDDEYAFLAIPFAGPLLVLGEIAGGSGEGTDALMVAPMIMSFVMQVTGATFAILGFLERDVLVPDEPSLEARALVVPGSAGADRGGASLLFTW